MLRMIDTRAVRQRNVPPLHRAAATGLTTRHGRSMV
jgi:hypothetical protein